MQKSVAINSCEAEYMILKEVSKELIWLKSFFKQIKLLNNYNADIIYCDNKSAINLSKSPEHHARTKHIDIQYHFVKDCIMQNLFKLLYINTSNQLTDALTKAINLNSFRNFVEKINLKDI